MSSIPRWVNSGLDAWGNWHLNEVFHEQGWSRESPFLDPGSFTGIFEHKILMPEMPARIRRFDLAVVTCPDPYPRILKAKYWLHQMPDGRLIYDSDRAALFDLGTGGFKSKVRRGKWLVLEKLRGAK